MLAITTDSPVRCLSIHSMQAVLELQRRGVADTGLVPPPIECSAIENVRALARPALFCCCGCCYFTGRHVAYACVREGHNMLHLRCLRHPPVLQLAPALQLTVIATDSPPPLPLAQVRSLDPCTHAYSFWEGVPVEGKAAFGALFAASRTLRSVAVVQRAIRWGQPCGAAGGATAWV